MRASIRYLLSTVGLVALLTGCATNNEPLANNTIPASLESELEGASPLAILSDALEKEGYTLNWSRAKSGTQDGLKATTLPLAEVTGQVVIGEQGGKVVYTQLSLFEKDGQPLEDWPVCHRPPGNPANAHTIYVGYPAVSTHLSKHNDSLGFCGSDATNADVSSTYVVLTAGNPPLTGTTTYDAQGNSVVKDAGESVGIATLETLTTVKPLPPIEEPGTGLNEFADFLRETLGEEADPFLEKIPASMGGTGPELDSDSPLSSLRLPPDRACGTSNSCSDDGDKDPPSTNKPDDGGDEGGNGGSGDEGGDSSSSGDSGDGDGGNDEGDDDSGSDNDDDDDDDDPSDKNSGPSYDTEELNRLETNVEAAEQTRDAFQRELNIIKGGIAEEFEKVNEKLEKLDPIVYGRSDEEDLSLAEREESISKLNTSAKEAQEDVNWAVVRVVGSAAVAEAGCVAGGVVGCAGGVALTVDAVNSLVELDETQNALVKERDGLISEQRELLEEAKPIALAAKVHLLNVRDLSEKQVQVAEDLGKAQANLVVAEGELSEFKQKNNIN